MEKGQEPRRRSDLETPQETSKADGASVEATRLIEIGWVLHGALDEREVDAAGRARSAALEQAGEWFPSFDWRFVLLEKKEGGAAVREAPVVLLEVGSAERALRHWDFAFVITASDLETHQKPFALGVPSRSLSVGVLSLFRLDPRAREKGVEEPDVRATGTDDPEVFARRIVALFFHVFGHLNGLSHEEDAEDIMYSPEEPADLDRMRRLSRDGRRALGEELEDVADLRAEERYETSRPNPITFYLYSSWIGRDEIASTVAQARPWEFFFRLSRLTTAAVSTMLIVLLTAEAWELGMSRSPFFVALLSLLALAGTSFYVLKRQRLLVRRGLRRLTEQAVVTNVSVVIVVLLGMASTYVFLFLLTLALAVVVFDPALASRWSGAGEDGVSAGDYLVLAAFVATLGISVGALGASFEGYLYFRHIAYVDEET